METGKEKNGRDAAEKRTVRVTDEEVSKKYKWMQRRGGKKGFGCRKESEKDEGVKRNEEKESEGFRLRKRRKRIKKDSKDIEGSQEGRER